MFNSLNSLGFHQCNRCSASEFSCDFFNRRYSPYESKHIQHTHTHTHTFRPQWGTLALRDYISLISNVLSSAIPWILDLALNGVSAHWIWGGGQEIWNLWSLLFLTYFAGAAVMVPLFMDLLDLLNHPNFIILVDPRRRLKFPSIS